MKTPILAAIAVALLVAGIVHVELGAQPRVEGDARNAELAAKQKTMIDAAKAAYAGILESHNLGRATSNNEVYAWSSHVRSSEVRAASSRQQVTKASQEHLERMRDLLERVVALGREGGPGGEQHKQAATQFYVAEAEVLLIEAKTQSAMPNLRQSGKP
jgi:hypothetical protein